MTRILLALAAVLFSFSVSVFAAARPVGMEMPQDNSIMKYIMESWFFRDIALHTIINGRCERYAPRDVVDYCDEGVSSLLGILDYDIKVIESENPAPTSSWKPDRFVFIAFKKNLIEILKSAKSSKYLDELNGHLTKKIYSNSYDFNIREFTIKFYNSEPVANMVMAALFQDTSPLMLHLQYIDFVKIPGSATFHDNKEKLAQNILLIAQIMDSSVKIDGDLFYPREIGASLYKNIYHFYVPVYIAQTMKSMGYSEKVSRAVPFMMTLTYEFVTTNEDYTYLFEDPEFLDPKVHDWKLKDIYGGYTGSRYGAQAKTGMKSFSSMSTSFGKSTLKAVQDLLK